MLFPSAAIAVTAATSATANRQIDDRQSDEFPAYRSYWFGGRGIVDESSGCHTDADAEQRGLRDEFYSSAGMLINLDCHQLSTIFLHYIVNTPRLADFLNPACRYKPHTLTTDNKKTT